MSKEMRKEKNRLAAKQSRDNKMAYIHELEDHLHMARDKCNILERELCASSQKLEEQHSQITALRAMLSNGKTVEDGSIFFLV